MTDHSESPGLKTSSNSLSPTELQMLERAVPTSQYNPYKWWMLNGDAYLVLLVKGDNFALAACPHLGLISKGTDYLTVSGNLNDKMKQALDAPQGTVISQTCSGVFTLEEALANSLCPPVKARSDASVTNVTNAQLGHEQQAVKSNPKSEVLLTHDLFAQAAMESDELDDDNQLSLI